eukprot:3705883-Pyramimonas_sp.AAC.1
MLGRGPGALCSRTGASRRSERVGAVSGASWLLAGLVCRSAAHGARRGFPRGCSGAEGCSFCARVLAGCSSCVGQAAVGGMVAPGLC